MTIEENNASAGFFKKQIENMKSLADQADKTVTKIANADENWFWRTFLKLFM